MGSKDDTFDILDSIEETQAEPSGDDTFSLLDAAEAPEESPQASSTSAADPSAANEGIAGMLNRGVVTPSVGEFPDQPIESSLLDVTDRLKMAFSNPRGGTKYLKSKFPDAQYDADNGRFVVKDNDGQWKTAEFDGMGPGDSWKISEALMDVAEGSASSAAPMAGGVAGAIATGANPLGVAGGATLGEGGNIVLGRLLGTYEASPEEMTQDLAWSALLNLGLAAAPPAFRKGIKNSVTSIKGSSGAIAKHIGQPTVRAVEAIGEGMKFLPAWGKDGVKTLMKATGMTDEAIETTVNNPEMFLSQWKRAFPKTRILSPEQAAQTKHRLTREAIDKTSELFGSARKTLGRQFQRMETKLLSSQGVKNLNIRPAEIVDDLAQGLDEMGLLQPSFTKGKITGYVAAPREKLMQTLVNEGNTGFNENAYQQLSKYAAGVSRLMKKPQIKGRGAAKAVLDLRRQLDDFYFDSVEGNPALRQTISPISNRVRQRLAGMFGEASVGKEAAERYTGMNAYFKNNIDKVISASRIAKNGLPGDESKSVESFLRSSVWKPGDKISGADLFDDIVKLSGDAGKITSDTVRGNHAVMEAMKFFPHLRGGISLGGSVANAARILTAPVSSPIVASHAVATSMKRGIGVASPAVANQLPFLKAFRDATADEQMSKALLTEPGALDEAVQMIQHADDAVNAEAEDMLKQGGVIE